MTCRLRAVDVYLCECTIDLEWAGVVLSQSGANYFLVRIGLTAAAADAIGLTETAPNAHVFVDDEARAARW